ncbi:glutamate synthase large subunit [Halomarina oriensis]|uniref:Glutamate synthase large subunit n=1 Tax=Halomarina oriensis TaxID=671145 RepID=A0A6B0GTY7_9EURY|nr:glutamate synthase large subunit [Halomarina oriensis]MWG35178.1 glutamate synthase large subunit [Halomarina oriensis]
MTGNTPDVASGGGLAPPDDDRSNCGVGVVMDLDGGRDHDVVADALELLYNLEHRGATADETGDGAGIMLQTPRDFFADVFEHLPERSAVGTLFLPQSVEHRERAKTLFEEAVGANDLRTVEWREVPTDNEGIGQTALDAEPSVWQVAVAPRGGTPAAEDDTAFDRRLYVARNAFEGAIRDADMDEERNYVCSLDRHVVVYKGMLTAQGLRKYYPDLRDEQVVSNFAMVHARFSTNTLGKWHLAHPHRRIIHNGEFNTLQGNVNWMRAREANLSHPDFSADDVDSLRPVVDPTASDTACIDASLELLMQGGRTLPHALRMLVPEAWRDDATNVDGARREFYDYHASLVEPWDGPAFVAATDGERVGAVLDRNGLRPCRYDVLEDDRLVLASEVGALQYDDSEVKERGRLSPGQLFLADPEEGRVVPDEEAFESLVDDRYGQWVRDGQVHLDDPETVTSLDVVENLRGHQTLHGYSQDELDELVEPMARDGKDPVGSMGDDTPLVGLETEDRPLASHFRQGFAQVTNPPLDYLREDLVTSLECRLGHQRNLLAETPEHAQQLVLDSPVVSESELADLKALDGDVDAVTLDTTFDPETSLHDAIEDLRERAQRATTEADVVVLSDRRVGADRLAVPSLLATSAVHHHLVRTGDRELVGLVVESGDVRTVHQFATLVGYGAGAVCPYLAVQSVEDVVAGPDGADEEEAVAAYFHALERGLLKTMARLGISTVESYRGAQAFEAVGLDAGFVAEYFEGTPARTGGFDLAAVEEQVRTRHSVATDDAELERLGEFAHRKTGMRHDWNPETVGTLQQAVRNDDEEQYREFSAIADADAERGTLRGRLTFDGERESIPVEEVEPVGDIAERFSTAAMSLGSLSPEMHETNAIAMNWLGAKSNTGEGGEPPERFDTPRNCNVKQVASGRFGVTAAYLANAEEIQIKMAQGSKPGEGGHLPGKKVNEYIAHVRCSTPGVGLISPPPLHDIYSIEDLKQLIFDLKAINPEADVNVKLVAGSGIGTIAAGVAKAGADAIHVSGHSGGTGASPKTSIKHAGLPWELGLAEANQMLRHTGLRDRVRLTTDGGLKTGRDVTVAAALGAEEYVFGTSSLVTAGCVMARKCHANTCPVGVATQREELRERFPGRPEHVVNYMLFIAREVREQLAELGLRSVDDLVGRVDLLEQREDQDVENRAALDCGALLAESDGPRRKTREQFEDERFGDRLLSRVGPALERGEPIQVSTDVRNTDRAVGATLSYHVARRYGTEGLPEGTIDLDLSGVAGQSFGAFLASGVSLHLTGTANDYVGKGLSGGRVVVETPGDAGYDPTESVAIGNVALYGATDGACYVNGVAGERFAVRNSGATAVVEGVGDHGCEYMTGGCVAVLGETGRNFAAGMSGGLAYVYDPDGTFDEDVNHGMVSTSRSLDERDERLLRRLVENHHTYTNSERAAQLLDDWQAALAEFVTVVPDPYAEVVAENEEYDVRRDLPTTAAASGEEDQSPLYGASD